MWSENQQRTKGWLSSDAIGRMFEIDEQGLVQLKLGGALYVAPDGKVRIRTGTTLTEGPGSPIELNANPRDSKFTVVTEEIVAESVSELAALLQTLRDLLTSPSASMVFGRGSAGGAGSGEWITLENGITMNGTALSFVLENRTSDPASPAVGQIWLRTDL